VYAVMKRLPELRRAKGWSQDALARRLKVSKGTVARWEQGSTLPRTQLLRRLARVLGVSVEELFEAPKEEAAV
jgi:transcriptional regulator with XRE-family HTH domain